MKKWKKFIAMGLAVSMIVPSCIPQTLWASEFSAGSVESAADVFEDSAEYETGSESGNKISDENNSGDEFGTGELKDQEPEQSETEDSVNAGQSAEGYNILLYSDGKLEKTYVIPYADADTAKVPEALRGKTGYIFKEWNTKEPVKLINREILLRNFLKQQIWQSRLRKPVRGQKPEKK